MAARVPQSGLPAAAAGGHRRDPSRRGAIIAATSGDRHDPNDEARCRRRIAAAGTAAAAQDKGTLNPLCSVELEWCALMSQTFERETGVKVNMLRRAPARCWRS